LLLACLVLAPGASARGSTQLGVFGNLDRFASLTGQHSQVGHVIVGWGQSTFSQIWPTLGPMPMLGFGSGAGSGAESITPLEIAHGQGDGYLLAMSASARSLGRPVYIRPLPEMNGHWNP
jgi:hypothetical protein